MQKKIITNPWGVIIPQGPNPIHTIFTLRMQQVFKNAMMKNLENSPDTSTCDSTVQTINTVTFIMCPAVKVPALTYNVN